MKRKHSEIAKTSFPITCELCERELKDERELKQHMKIHSYKKSEFKCEDCSFVGSNEWTMEIHYGRVHKETLACGLCDLEVNDSEQLEIHLSTCEAYVCDCDCDYRTKQLSELKKHTEKNHSTFPNIYIYHVKLDRKNEEEATYKYHASNDIF